MKTSRHSATWRRILSVCLCLLLMLSLCLTAMAAPSGGGPGDGGTPPDSNGSGGPGGTPPDGNGSGGSGGTPPDGNGSGGSGGPGGGSSAPTSYDAVVTLDSDTTISGESYSSTGTDENAILITGGNVSLSDIQVSRVSSDSTGGDNSSFYGVGAAILATGGTATISNAEIETDARGGAGVFAYGDAVVTVSDTTIHTNESTSGGIHAAGGGTLYANNVTATTEGGSAAAVRSDRGGGTMVVRGGQFTSNGSGSPAVYCTANIVIDGAVLTATGSEAVCIEGLNSLYLYDCDLTGDMPVDSAQNDTTWNVILYQSMSGDSKVGNSTFQMTGGTLTAKNGGMFYTTNTESTFVLENVNIQYADDAPFFLQSTGNSNARGWGSTGSNGANCTFTARDQAMTGDVIWDSTGTLDFYVLDGSTLQGAVLQTEDYGTGDGYANLTIDEDSTWVVTADSALTTLCCAGSLVDPDGKTVSVVDAEGTVLVEGDSAYTVTVDTFSDSVDISSAGTVLALDDATTAITDASATSSDDNTPADGNAPSDGNAPDGNAPDGNTPPSDGNAPADGNAPDGNTPPDDGNAPSDDNASSTASSYTDVADTAWYASAVAYVTDKGLMNGTGGGAFSPSSNVQRAAAVTVLYRLAGSPETNGTSFSDVPAGSYYADAVAWCAENNVVTGNTDGTFDPTGDITREQLAAILYRYATATGLDLSSVSGDLSVFSDQADIHEYARDAMACAVGAGILQGMEDGTLAPRGTTTRAQLATILMRYDQLLTSMGVNTGDNTGDNTSSDTSSDTPVALEDQLTGAERRAYIEETLNLKNSANQEWTYNESADAWVLSVVSAVVYPEISNQQGVSVCVPGAYVKGIDTDGDGEVDATDGTVQGSLVIDYDAQVTSSNGQIYTASTAPLILNTGAAGYSSSTNTKAATSYASEGYINISCGNRGKQDTATDADGNTYYTGDAPSCLVDQKNATRFVRYNILLGNLPGSVDYLVSTGGSGGGAHATMFAATSDHPDFYPYEYEAGAVGVWLQDDGSYDTTVTVDGASVELSDGAWGTVAYSAITSLAEADMAMAFEYNLDDSYGFNTPFQAAMGGYLAQAYAEYINGQNLSVDESAVGFDLNGDGDMDDNVALTIETDGETYSGSYLDLYLDVFQESLQWYLDNIDYADGWTWFDADGAALSDDDVAAMSHADRVSAFLEGRVATSSGGGMGGPGGGMGGGMGGFGGGPDGGMGGPPDGGNGRTIGNDEVAANSTGDTMDVGTPDAGTTQSSGSKTDSANYATYEEMVAAYASDIAAVQAGDRYGNNQVELYDPLRYIGQEETNNPTWTRILMGASEGDMSMFSSLNLHLAFLNAGVDSHVSWQWNGGHVPSEIFGESLALWVDTMYGEHVPGAVKITKAQATPATTNGSADEPTGTDISSWVSLDDDGQVSFSLAAAANYRTSGASKATPGFDVMDYGQEDYVFGSAEADARHWDAHVLTILQTYADTLSALFNQAS